jgi:hypothetical protein
MRVMMRWTVPVAAGNAAILSGAMPLVAEPLFQALDAAVEIVPVMSAEDLKKAFAKLAS